MAVSERAKQLFGDDGADAVADWIERDPVKNLQQVLFPEFEEEQAPKIRGRGRGRRKLTLDPSAVEGDSMREATTLDRVHAAMLLQAGGQSNALRALIKAEQERGPDFLRWRTPCRRSILRKRGKAAPGCNATGGAEVIHCCISLMDPIWTGTRLESGVLRLDFSALPFSLTIDWHFLVIQDTNGWSSRCSRKQRKPGLGCCI